MASHPHQHRVLGHGLVTTQKESEMTTYRIVRFKRDDDNEVLVRGLTLEQAQAHCQREDTHGDGWFDGYAEEES